MGLLGFLVMLSIAVVVGFVGSVLVRGVTPYGWAIATILGSIGSLMGTALFGGWGPGLGGVFIFPATVGAAVFVSLLELILSAFAANPSP